MNGHTKTENGHVKTENGHGIANGLVIANGHTTSITENGHIKTESDHIIAENGHCKAENGHIGNRFAQNCCYTNSSAQNENGYIRNENGYLKNGYTNGHAVHDKDKIKVQ